MITHNIYDFRSYQLLLKGAQTVTTVPTANLTAVTRNRVLRAIDPSWTKGKGNMPHRGAARMLVDLLRDEYQIPQTETWGDEAEFNVRYEHLPPEAHARLNELFLAEKAAIRMHPKGDYRDYRLGYISRGYGIWGEDTLPPTGRFEFRHVRPDHEVKEMMLAVSKRPENLERIQLAVQHVLDGRPLQIIYTKE